MFPTLFPWHPLTAESVVYGSGGGVVASLGELSCAVHLRRACVGLSRSPFVLVSPTPLVPSGCAMCWCSAFVWLLHSRCQPWARSELML